MLPKAIILYMGGAGLQFPNLRWYYVAAQLTSASYYFYTTAPPTWVSIEQESIPELPLNSYLYSSDIESLNKRTKNPFLKNTISVWYTAHKNVGDMPVLSQLSPVLGNEQFMLGETDGGFRSWNIKGI